jgi:ParB family chromosome partitioning protein
MNKLPVGESAMMPLVQKDLSHEESNALKPWEDPKTSPETTLAFDRQESIVFADNEKLRTELESFRSGSLTRKIDATLISRSKWANRHEESLTAKAFVDLKTEIKSAGGNVQPIKIRPLAGETGKFELVFGHRRHQACLELGLPVLAMIEPIDDQQLFMEMERENRDRADLRPYELGLMYARALDEGLFPSLRKLSESLGVDASGVSKLLSLARLPQKVLSAFRSPLEIQFAWGALIHAALQKEPEVVLGRAKELASLNPKKSAKEVFSNLTGAGEDSIHTPTVIEGKAGAKAKFSFDPKKKAVGIHIVGVDLNRLVELEQLVKRFLEK